jgi:hypothetical protein
MKFIALMFSRSADKNMKRLAKIGIDDVNLWDSIPNANIPCLIVHGMYDDFITVRQSREIIGKYGCAEKFLWTVPGDHASEREVEVYVMMVDFVLKLFNLDVEIETCRFQPDPDMSPDGMHYRNAADMAKNV